MSKSMVRDWYPLVFCNRSLPNDCSISKSCANTSSGDRNVRHTKQVFKKASPANPQDGVS